MKNFTLILSALTLLFIGFGCGDTGQATGENQEADDMKQFTEDESFRDAHEKPDSIRLEDLGKMITFPSPDGQEAAAFEIQPEGDIRHTLLVIHEWWGLNDHIKREAQRLFRVLPDTRVLALDLYDGKVATDPDQATEFMNAVSNERAEAIIKGAIQFTGESEDLATIGWCFGGGWSLRASILAGERSKACVMYYGMPVQKASELAPLKADVLGLFAEKDGWINEEVISDFKALAKATGKNLEVHTFDAEHAFANPSGPRYDEEAAQKANKLARDFLLSHLN